MNVVCCCIHCLPSLVSGIRHIALADTIMKMVVKCGGAAPQTSATLGASRSPVVLLFMLITQDLGRFQSDSRQGATNILAQFSTGCFKSLDNMVFHHLPKNYKSQNFNFTTCLLLQIPIVLYANSITVCPFFYLSNNMDNEDI